VATTKGSLGEPKEITMLKPTFTVVVSGLAVAVLAVTATGLEATAGARKGEGETMQPAAGADNLRGNTQPKKGPDLSFDKFDDYVPPPPPKPKPPKEDCMSCAD
jgi:hypothetical protein